MGQTVGFRVRAHWRRWVVVVVVVSVLCVVHPWFIEAFGPWPKSGDREGLIVRDDFRLHWEERRSLGQRYIDIELQDADYPIWRSWSDLPRVAPPGWAPALEIGVFEGKGNWTWKGEASIRAYGLPAPCLRTMWMKSNRGTNRSVGLEVKIPWGGWRFLPTWVYWPGMLLNLLVWNAAALAGFVGLDAIIGLRRVRRGRCVRCGYDIGVGAAFCPECGTGAGEAAEP